MFPLSGSSFPTSAEQLADSLEKGLRAVLAPAGGKALVTLQAAEFPMADELTIDASGARVVESGAPPTPHGLAPVEHALTAKRFALKGDPLLVRDAAVRVDLQASDVRFDYAKDSGGHIYLVPSVSENADAAAGGGTGSVRLSATHADIEKLMVSFVAPLAKEQGVELQDVDLKLTSEGPRTVAAEVGATGKKLFVKARIHVRGRLSVDDNLVATVDRLECSGEGIVGGIAKNVIAPKLAQFEGTRVPLAGFSLGGLSLSDLQVSTADGIEVKAKLG